MVAFRLGCPKCSSHLQFRIFYRWNWLYLDIDGFICDIYNNHLSLRSRGTSRYSHGKISLNVSFSSLLSHSAAKSSADKDQVKSMFNLVLLKGGKEGTGFKCTSEILGCVGFLRNISICWFCTCFHSFSPFIFAYFFACVHFHIPSFQMPEEQAFLSCFFLRADQDHSFSPSFLHARLRSFSYSFLSDAWRASILRADQDHSFSPFIFACFFACVHFHIPSFQMPEEQAFCVLTKIMFDYGMRDLFKQGFEELHLKFYQLERLMQVRLHCCPAHLTSHHQSPRAERCGKPGITKWSSVKEWPWSIISLTSMGTLKGSIGEISQRRVGGRSGFSECIDTILNWTELYITSLTCHVSQCLHHQPTAQGRTTCGGWPLLQWITPCLLAPQFVTNSWLLTQVMLLSFLVVGLLFAAVRSIKVQSLTHCAAGLSWQQTL